jgi:tetratricopeptide (TPR) repeat protein
MIQVKNNFHLIKIKLFPISILILLSSLKVNCQYKISYDAYQAAQRLNNSAVKDIKSKNYNTAIDKLIRAISIDSTNHSAYLNLNDACTKTKQLYLLRTYLGKAKRIFYDDDEILYYSGNLYQKLEDYERAVSDYSLAIKYSKVNGEDFPLVYSYYLNRGKCYYMLQKYDLALKDYAYATKLDKSKSAIYINRAIILVKLNRYTEACADWKKALSLGDKTAQGYISKYCK